jgi:formamidopyrimidine-DNA glycosylase
MPELPEVQTVVTSLSARLEGLQIKSIDFTSRGQSMISSDHSPTQINDLLVGRKINSIKRIGKFIKFELGQDLELYIHLRMTGTFYFGSQNIKKIGPELVYSNPGNNKFDYLQFQINLDDKNHELNSADSNLTLYFFDKRRFATFYLKESDDTYKSISRLGPDALSAEFNQDYLSEIFARRQKNIYLSLLDQSIVTGIGNIYANEILYASMLHPLTSVKKLKYSDYSEIINNTKIILQKAIQMQGTSFSDYLNINGEKGSFQDFLQVYQQEYVLVDKNKYKVVRQKIGGRSVFFVPKFQIMKI